MKRIGNATPFRAIVCALAWACAIPASAAVPRATVTAPGAFALVGIPRASEATLRYRTLGARAVALEIAFEAHGKPLRAFDLEMTQRMHLIAIDRELATFEHVHPRLRSDGRFTIDLRVPHPGRYEIYADTTPHGVGQQVFRFDVAVGASAPARGRAAVPESPVTPDLSDARARDVRSGAYAVHLDSLALRVGEETRLDVTVSKDGTVANDLRPYLGGAAHAVFIDTTTLAYVHVHPSSRDAADRVALDAAQAGAMEDMAGMPAMHGAAPLADDAHVAGRMVLHVAAPRAGRYKLWLQFRGSDGLHVAPFTLVAR